MSDALGDAYAKLARTRVQIDQLHRMVEGFLMYWPVGSTSKVDPGPDEETWSFAIGSPIPKDIPILIGEILLNLRAPLDYLACAIALKYSGSNKGVAFPFGRDQAGLEVQIKEKARRLPAAAVDLIRHWKPYKGGSDLLWAIHNLNISDKHLNLLPVNLRTGANSTTYLTVWTGLALVIGSRKGQHLLVERRSAEEISAMGSPTAVYEVGPGTQLNFGTAGCTAEESMQYLTCTPGATFSTDMRPSLDVAFVEHVGDPLEPVGAVLLRMSGTALSLVEEFDKNFF